MTTSNITVRSLTNYMKNGMNVLLVGHAGLGKTFMLMQAAEKLGYKMKMLNAPTIDPFAHFVGIPTPNETRDKINWLRSTDFEEADIIFIDEYNRADDATQNACFELVQFGSINGEKLPNLKCVVAAMNPAEEGYKVDEMDIALMDRFDVYGEMPIRIDPVYFRSMFGKHIGDEAVKIWEEYNDSRKKSIQRNANNAPGYFSPRKMEAIVKSFLKIGSHEMVSAAIPPGVTLSARDVFTRLQRAQREQASPEASTLPSARSSNVSGVMQMNSAAVRRNVHSVLREWENNNSNRDEMFRHIASSISVYVGSEKLVNDWRPFIASLDKKEMLSFVRMMSKPKASEVSRRLFGVATNNDATKIAQSFRMALPLQ